MSYHMGIVRGGGAEISIYWFVGCDLGRYCGSLVGRVCHPPISQLKVQRKCMSLYAVTP